MDTSYYLDLSAILSVCTSRCAGQICKAVLQTALWQQYCSSTHKPSICKAVLQTALWQQYCSSTHKPSICTVRAAPLSEASHGILKSCLEKDRSLLKGSRWLGGVCSIRRKAHRHHRRGSNKEVPVPMQVV